jgi:CyaY protein
MVARLGGQDERTLVATGRERECGTVDQATGSNESFHAEMLQHGGNVEEREFLTLADAELNRIEQVLERLQEDSDADWDFEIKPGGILELDFADASKIIINRHVAAREIWVAAKSAIGWIRAMAEAWLICCLHASAPNQACWRGWTGEDYCVRPGVTGRTWAS